MIGAKGLLCAFPVLAHNVGSLQPSRLQELSLACRSVAVGGLTGTCRRRPQASARGDPRPEHTREST
eukprot:1035472-Pyramimonas_sp.AAC.1